MNRITNSPRGGLRRQMRWASVLAVALAGFVGVTACSSDQDSAAQPKPKIVVGVSNLVANYAPLYWAKYEGYFDKAKLDVDVQALNEGTVPALVSGRTDMLGSSAGSVLSTANSGRPMKAIYEMDSAPQIVVAADPAITTMSQCTSMATSVPGTNVRAMTVLAMRVLKVDWELVQLSNGDAFVPTLLSGRADCGMGVQSQFGQAMVQGKLHKIFDTTETAKLPSGWPAQGGSKNVLSGLADHLDGRSADIARFLKAYDEAVQVYVKTPPAQIAATLIQNKSGWEAIRPESLTASIEATVPAMRPNNGYLTDASWEATLRYFADGGLDYVKPDETKWSYESLVDTSYYRDGIGDPPTG